MATKPLVGLDKIEAYARSLLKSQGPTRILVLNRSGLPVLHVARDRAVGSDLERDAAHGAEMARLVFTASSEYAGSALRRTELHFDSELMTILRDAPFDLIATWPTNATRPLVTAGEEAMQRLLTALQEELT